MGVIVTLRVLPLLLVAACAAPIPEPEPEPCPDGGVRDGEICVPEGCESARWEERAAEARAFVAEGGRDEAAGTRTDPFGSIQVAADSLGGEAGLVLIDAGTYGGAISLGPQHAGLEIAGRCRDEVIVEATDEGSGFDVGGSADVGLSDLSVRGGAQGFWAWSAGGPADPILRLSRVRSFEVVGGGIWVEGFGTEVEVDDVEVLDGGEPTGGLTTMAVIATGGGSITGSGIRVDGFTGLGLAATGGLAEVHVRDVKIRNFRPTDDGSIVAGFVVQGPATLEVENFEVRDFYDFGAFADGSDGVLVLREGVLADAAEGGGYEGVGLFFQEGARATVEGTVIEGARATGIYAVGPDMTLDLRDSVVRGTLPDAEGAHGEGVVVYEGAVVTAQNLSLEGNSSVGLGVNGAGSEASLVDSAVWGTRRTGETESSRGVEVTDGGLVTFVGGEVYDNDQVGFAALGAGARLELAGATVRDQRVVDGIVEGQGGIGVGFGAELIGEDLVVDRNPAVGILVSDSTATLRAVVVADTMAVDYEGDRMARGAAFQGAAEVVAEGLTIERNSDVGLFLETADVELLDTTVRGGRAEEGALEGGRGINVSGGATVVATNLVVENNQEVGILLGQPGSHLTIHGAVIRGTVLDQMGHYGQGFHIQEGGSTVATDLVVEGNHLIGVLVTGEDSTVDLVGGAVRETDTTRDGAYGRGLYLGQGATGEVRGTVFEGNRDVAVMVSEGSVLHLEDVTIFDTRWAAEPSGGVGAAVQEDGALTAERVEIVGNSGPGFVLSGGTASFVDCVASGNAFGGVVVFEGALSWTAGTIEDAPEHPEFGGGVGIFADALGSTIEIEVEDLVLQDLRGPAIYLREPMTAEFVGVSTADVATEVGAPAAVMALDGLEPWDSTADRGLLVRDSVIGAVGGDGVLLHGSAARIENTTFGGSGGFDVVEQNCAAGPESILDGGVGYAACDAPIRVVEPKLIFNFSALGFLVVL